MNRVTRGTVVLAAALAALTSCKGDPTDSLRNGVDHLVAFPSELFVKPDSTKAIQVEAVDEQGNRQATSFSITANPTGATVAEDTTYNLVFDAKGNASRPDPWTRARYNITATSQFGSTSFTVKAGGKSLVIPVRILPDTATTLTISNATPALGDTVTATAGAGFKFTPLSQASVSGASVVTLGISTDSTVISFLVGPSGNGPVTVSNMVLSYATPVGGYAATSGGTVLTTPTISSVAATFSSATPAAGAALTVTLPAGYKFVSGQAVDFGGAEGFDPQFAADSNSVTVIPPPGYTGPVSLSNIALDFLLGAPISVPTASNVTVGAGLAGTDDPVTAPTITIPVGSTNTFYDNGDPFAGAVFGVDRVYKFTLASAAVVQVTLDWSNDADVDILFATSGLGLITSGGCLGGATGAQPEHVSCSLAAGTYYLVPDLYAGTAPAVLQITVGQ